MGHNVLRLAALLLLTLMLSGCHTEETEDVAFITALGIDQAGNGKLKFTYAVAVPRAVGSSQGAGQPPSAGPTVVNSNIASDVGASRNLLGSTMSRAVNISHLKAVLISEDLAQQGLAKIVSPVTRFREYRSSILLFIVKGKAEDFLAANRPKLDYLLSKYFETFALSAEENNYFQRTDMHEFYLGLKNPGHSAYATYVAINPLSGEDRPYGPKLPAGKADSYLAGDIPRAGNQNPVELAGLAVFSGDRMVGVLGTREVRTLALLQNKAGGNTHSLADPLQAECSLRLRIRNGERPDIAVHLVDGQETIKIRLSLEGEITANPSGINYEDDEYRPLLEEHIANLVTAEIYEFTRQTQALGSDVFGFGRYLRSHFRTYQELQGLNLEQLYKTASVEVQVTAKIRRSGLMWRTAPAKPGANS